MKNRKFGNIGWTGYTLATHWEKDLQEAFKPRPKNGPVRTLQQMTDDEIIDIERIYGCKVKRS